MKVVQFKNQLVQHEQSVTDSDIEKILSLRESREFLKKRLAAIEDDLTSAEENLVQRLEVGVPVQAKYPLEIKTRERYFPSWKDAFLNRLGNIEAAKVMAQTSPKIYKSLIILK